jgi:molybdopterin molybdotransferase
MISVEEAINLILKHSKQLSQKEVKIMDGLGCTLSANIKSPLNLPPFDQSAMDGYAFKFADQTNYKIVGEVAAGAVFKKKIKQNEAVRIFTGASVPKDTDTVVMQEKVSVANGNLILQDPNLRQGLNIRKAASQIKKGAVALQKGELITPGAIGYLTAMGISKVKIISPPRITIIITGSELKKPGIKLKEGEIYESNSFAVNSALRSIHLNSLRTVIVKDNESEVFSAIKKAIANSDLVLVTGGISVGDYDFTGSSLKKIGVENIFYKIKQKPGKPIFFGKHKKALIFGLPGNPAAVLSCFYEYVYPALRIMQGRKDVFLKKINLPLEKDYNKKPGLSFFLKGKLSGETVTPLEGQESYILSSFANADCLIYLPAEKEDLKAGEIVEVHLLPVI